MRRRILSILMAAAMALSLLPVSALAADVNTADAFQKALNGSGDIRLTADVEGNFIVPDGATVTLNLNGKTITNEDDHTITVEKGGTLTITGSGTVDNVTHARAAIWNEGTVILSGGTYTRSQENGESAASSGGNSYYNIVNHGTMTINSGVTVEQDGHFSSMIENGYSNYISGDATSGYVPDTNDANPSLTINGGTFTGGLNTVKNDDGGKLEIKGGTFTNNSQASVLNWHEATISGGTFSVTDKAETCILNGAYSISSTVHDQGQLTITGGSFTASEGKTCITNNFTDETAPDVSGGTFSSPVPQGFCADGYETATIGGKTVVVTNSENTGSAVATVDGLGFNSLRNALDAAVAQAEETVTEPVTVTLHQNATFGTESYNLTTDKAIVLDLNKHTITDGRLNLLQGDLTLRNGTVKPNTTSQPINVYGAGETTGGSSELTVEDDVTIEAVFGICIFPEASSGNKYGYNATVNVYGNVTGSSGGVFVSGNIGADPDVNDDMQDNPDNLPVLNIYDGAEVSGADSSQGVALNGLAVVNIYDGATVTGTEAVGVKSGILNVYGGTLTAVGAAQDPATANNNGTEETGAAISITGTYSKYGPIAVNVEGGSITSTNGTALYLGHSRDSNGDVTYKHTVEMSVTGGDFTGKNGAVYLAEPIEGDEEYSRKVISGGTFSNAVSEDYCAPGFEPVTVSGKFTVQLEENLAAQVQNGNGQVVGAYGTLAKALTEAASGQKVVLLANATLANAIPDGVTLEVPDGKTLTVDGTAAAAVLGSTGTLEVQNGGGFSIPNYELIGEGKIIELTAGSAEVVFSTGTVTLKSGAKADILQDLNLLIPAVNKKLDVTIESGAEANLAAGAKLTVPNGAKLTVDGTLNVAGGGILRVNSEAALAGGGTVTNSGIITLHHGDSSDANVTAAITLASGGAVYSQFDVTSTINNSTESVLDPAQTVEGVANETEEAGSNEPTFGYQYSYYVPSSSSGGSTRYTVTAPADVANGSVKVSPTRASYNQTVTVTVTPDEGYQLASIAVTDRSGNTIEVERGNANQYTFKMPRGAVSIAVTFEEIAPWTSPYVDVTAGDWFYGAVEYVVDNGLMTGTSSTTFEPDAQLTRGMMATVLWAMSGGPVVNYAMDYTDVSDGDWYAEAVRWATSTGVVTGMGDGTYEPNAPITREQMMVMLYAYAVRAGYDVDQGGMSAREFDDYGEISGWAVTAMEWAVNTGMIGGKPGNILDPGGNATRAEVATILRNYHQTFVAE